MSHFDWYGRIRAGFSQANGGSKVFVLLLLLAVLGLVNDGWQTVRHVWQELRRPVAVYRGRIGNGLAISLNGLEKWQETGGRLPELDLRGVLLDRTRNDWILFGEANSERPGLSLDAVAVTLRAIRLHLEAPGIDIQPRRGSGSERQAVQEVRYFGGVGGTVVGMWFFRFDYWMKRMSLGQEPVLLSGIPVYWHRAVQALDNELQACSLSGSAHWTRRNRYWLCVGDFAAVEGDDTLAFESTPLQVLAEHLPDASEMTANPESPCVSRGTDDPLAAEYAHWLSAHLAELTQVVPVSEIENFARLLAGLTWLADVDPYRDLRPWLNAPLTPADTPATVPTLAKYAVREHTVIRLGARVLHQHRLELSGGVLVAPSLVRARVGDNSLFLLHQAVVLARPAGQPTVWPFTFSPPAT